MGFWLFLMDLYVALQFIKQYVLILYILENIEKHKQE